MMTHGPDSVSRMLDGYEPILRQFIDGQTTADAFESAYLSFFKNDQHQVVGEEFDVLDGLFADIDEYVSEPELRATTGGIDADELRKRAERAYSALFDGGRR